jgi:dTDP-4-dehydrorhamnose reductase
MIWLIGNKGMLGSDVEKLLKEINLKYWATGKEVDITDYKALEKYGRDKKIEWIINCAGYTQVDKAEEEEEKAFSLNQVGVQNISLFCSKRKIRLIHISTDYVFDGKKNLADSYSEEDKPNPLGIYGKSKLAGEREIKNILNSYFIIRTAWLYGENGSNFVYTMLKLFKERHTLKVVDDQWGSPTYTGDLAGAILKIIKNNSNQYGIYHFTNERITNWYKFAKEIYRQAKEIGLIDRNKEVSIMPIKTVDYPTQAVRATNSILSKEKIKQIFNIKIRPWNGALEEFLNNLSDSDFS